MPEERWIIQRRQGSYPTIAGVVGMLRIRWSTCSGLCTPGGYLECSTRRLRHEIPRLWLCLTGPILANRCRGLPALSLEEWKR